jgi:hypothetical protein
MKSSLMGQHVFVDFQFGNFRNGHQFRVLRCYVLADYGNVVWVLPIGNGLVVDGLPSFVSKKNLAKALGQDETEIYVEEIHGPVRPVNYIWV